MPAAVLFRSKAVHDQHDGRSEGPRLIVMISVNGLHKAQLAHILRPRDSAVATRDPTATPEKTNHAAIRPTNPEEGVERMQQSLQCSDYDEIDGPIPEESAADQACVKSLQAGRDAAHQETSTLKKTSPGHVLHEQPCKRAYGKVTPPLIQKSNHQTRQSSRASLKKTTSSRPLRKSSNSEEAYFSQKIYECGEHITSGKVMQHINAWERRMGIKYKQDVDDEQVVIPNDARYLIVTEFTISEPYIPMILFCRCIDKERAYIRKCAGNDGRENVTYYQPGSVAKLGPVFAIFYDTQSKPEQFPSLLQEMDGLCAETVLDLVEKVDGSAMSYRSRFIEINALLDLAAQGEFKKDRKLIKGIKSATRWIANVEEHFL